MERVNNRRFRWSGAAHANPFGVVEEEKLFLIAGPPAENPPKVITREYAFRVPCESFWKVFEDKAETRLYS